MPAAIVSTVLNAMNPDLVFTAEIEEEFPNYKLPTLDVQLWLKGDGKRWFDYFQKPMKTLYVVMKGSARHFSRKCLS